MKLLEFLLIILLVGLIAAGGVVGLGELQAKDAQIAALQRAASDQAARDAALAGVAETDCGRPRRRRGAGRRGDRAAGRAGAPHRSQGPADVLGGRHPERHAMRSAVLVAAIGALLCGCAAGNTGAKLRIDHVQLPALWRRRRRCSSRRPCPAELARYG